MKILYVIHEFFPDWYTGTARVGLNIAKYMQKMGHEVKMLTYGINETGNLTASGSVLYKKYEYDSIQVISFRDRYINPKIHINIFNSDIEKDMKQIIEYEKLDDVDIAHIVHPLRTGVVVKILEEKGIPILLTLTDYWTICPGVQLLKHDYSICNSPDPEKCSLECMYNMSDIKKRIEDAQYLLNLADVITVPSNVVKHVFKINGFDHEKIQIINHGIDYKLFSKINSKLYTKDDTVTFGHIGPILRHKGIHILIDAFLKTRLSHIKLKIYGPHSYDKEYYEQLKKSIRGDNRIVFMGKFEYSNLSDIYRDIDITIFSSIWYETYGLVLTESLAHRVPVIASNTIGSAIEFVKNGSGITFNMGNIDELTGIIEKIGKNPLLINELKNNIVYPPMIEEEALYYEKIYNRLMAV